MPRSSENEACNGKYRRVSHRDFSANDDDDNSGNEDVGNSGDDRDQYRIITMIVIIMITMMILIIMIFFKFILSKFM